MVADDSPPPLDRDTPADSPIETNGRGRGRIVFASTRDGPRHIDVVERDGPSLAIAASVDFMGTDILEIDRLGNLRRRLTSSEGDDIDPDWTR
ncbi:MAG: hypothetical protein ACYTCU_05210 [Planctomycetota bacterium]|jgi:hypothetical protein